MFGRPAHTWSFDGEKIGTYVNYDLMVKEYTTAATGKELYEAVGKTAFDKYDFESYVNGEDSDLHEDISKDNKGNVNYTLNRADVEDVYKRQVLHRSLCLQPKVRQRIGSPGWRAEQTTIL